MSKIQDRLNRILLLVPFMVGDDGASIPEICARFGITKSQLLDDLRLLWLCGLPSYGPGDLIDIRIDGERAYVMMADYFKRPLTLTREEALALIVAGRALIKSGVFDPEGPLSSALGKVQNLLSAEDRVELENLSERIDVEMDAYSGRWSTIIERGLEEHRCLLIEYYSFSRGEVGSREVEPICILWSKGYWYLQAYCHEACDHRLFRLDRIKRVSLTDRVVTVEEGEPFNIPELIGEYRPGKKSHRVRLVFEGREGRRLVEEWPTAVVKEKKGGSVSVELRTRSLAWLASYLLRYGDRFRIESPKELARLVEKKAGRMLEAYV